MKILMTEPLQPIGPDVFANHTDVEVVTPAALKEDALIEAARDVDGIVVRSVKFSMRHPTWI